MKRIHYVKPSITELETSLAAEAMQVAWGEHAGTYVSLFEREFAAEVGAKYAIATSSCTGALHLGLAALKLSAGDEVILADTNWVATVSPLVHLGFVPIFVDIDSRTWCISPDQVRAAITSRTKAVIATHLYGNASYIIELRKICDEFGLFLIEDSAEAIGTYIQEKHVGTFGKFGVFSFHGSKTLTCGEGGMLVTDDFELNVAVRTLNNHGRASSEHRQFWASTVGYKYKMTDVQAAIGLGQVRRFEELTGRKREILENYRALFSHIEDVSLNPNVENVTNGAWMPNLVFDKRVQVNIERLRDHMNALNIDARVFFWPLSSMGIYGAPVNNEISYDLPARSLNLPSFHDMTDEDQNRVYNAVTKFLGV